MQYTFRILLHTLLSSTRLFGLIKYTYIQEKSLHTMLYVDFFSFNFCSPINFYVIFYSYSLCSLNILDCKSLKQCYSMFSLNKTFFKMTYICIYIIGHYNPSVRIIDIVSHTTYIVC